MLAQAQISAAIEEERKSDPYHLSSMVLSLGCLFTEGGHLYWNASHTLGKEARNILLEAMEKLERQFGAKMTVLRDFGEHTPWNEPLYGQGFLRVQMPNACYVVLNGVDSMEDYLHRLSSETEDIFERTSSPISIGQRQLFCLHYQTLKLNRSNPCSGKYSPEIWGSIPFPFQTPCLKR